ncbi:MAG: arginine--tRNA ligase [Candidatus Lokiarchaeota archaeon]|nr:arginine--tRNA ligase [Candidatus Lokiarchaeota archaeon]
MIEFKEEITKILEPIIKIEKSLIEKPPNPEFGDYSIPCFKLAKEFRKDPKQIAEELAKKITLGIYFSSVKNIGAYLNFFVSREELIKNNLTYIFKKKEEFGSQIIGQNKTLVVDFSSPNIAKPFGIAHLRSTVIGNALCNIFSKLGYKIIKINHLGDWGTQFGKLMVAFDEWGDEKNLEENAIDYLVKIYIEFGQKVKDNPDLNEKARKSFKNLENGAHKETKYWERFRELSLEEFQKYYDRLNISFDYFQGESFYNNKLTDTINFLKDNIQTEISEKALITKLEDKGIKTPMIIQKSDGASTYHTRDIAAALYRIKEYNPEKILYVVGAPQKLHFKQLFAVLDNLGFDENKFIHIDFGTMTYEGVMMSTRQGNFIPLSEVLDKVINAAREIIEEKNPDLPEKSLVSEQVGIGAIIFGDLSNDRTNDIDFSWQKALDFKGETAPYIQYTHARICSILRKSEDKLNIVVNFNLLKEDIEFELIKILGEYREIIQKAAIDYKPHIIASYLIEVSQTFNKFYNICNILKEYKELREARLLLAECTRIILKNGLNILGISAPKNM